LKEIFVSNTLNMVSMASKDQSIQDENGERTDVYSLIGQTIAGRFGGQTGSLDFRMPPQQQVSKYELQQKIKEKTAVIRKLLSNDPRLKKLMPYVEVITLENMIDVPVIVGTSAYSIDTLTLAFVLAAAISLKKPLNTWANVQQVFNVIENTPQDEAWTLFNNLIDNDKKTTGERLITWVGADHPRLAALMQQFGSSVKGAVTDVGRFVGKVTGLNKAGEFGREYLKPWVPASGRGGRETDPSEPEYDPNLPFKSDPRFDIMKTVKGDLDQAKLFFKFMLDDNLLRTQFGLDKNPGQMSTAVKKISSQGESLFFQMHQNFMELVGYNANIPISSFFNTIYPWDSNIDYLQTKNKFLDQELNNVVDELNEEFKTLLANTFGSEGVDTTRAKNMKRLCTAGLEQTTSMIQGRTKQLADARIGKPDHSVEDLKRFLKALEDTSSEFSSSIEKLKYQLSTVVNNSKAYFEKVDNKVDEVVDHMIGAYDRSYRRSDNGAFTNIALSRNGILNANNDPQGQKTINYINQGKSYLTTIILTMYYTSVVDAVCQYVKYLDVEIET
ncbi:MAG: hypothetical protein R3250_16270, partial [Melioribacteraceae bacterium]|nr:hypothetical protein [Melioribacteraceae bacterium]